MKTTLNIQITLNDKQLKDLIVDNINDLPKEALQNILLESIRSFLASEIGQNLFYEGTPYYNSEKRPTDFLRSLVQKADIKDSITPVVNDVIEKFSSNYPEVLRNCILSCISEIFLSNMDRSKLDFAFNQTMNSNSN